MKPLPPELRIQRVEVYRNLRHNCLSIRRQGIVLGHAQAVQLQNVRFVVQPAGRQKVLRERQKNVHAFARGKLLGATNDLPEGLNRLVRVSYNPFKHSSFYRVTDELPVTSAEAVWVTTTGIYILEGDVG